MSIPNFLQKGNRIGTFLVSGIVFGVLLGISGGLVLFCETRGRSAPYFTASVLYGATAAKSSQFLAALTLVASKTGTKYYASSCGGAQHIKPENLLTFANREDAEQRGFTPAANCVDLKPDELE